MGVCENPGDLTAEHGSGDYCAFYDVAIGEEAYAVAIHNEGMGVTVLERDDPAAPDSDIPSFETFLEDGDPELFATVEKAALDTLATGNGLPAEIGAAVFEAKSPIDLYNDPIGIDDIHEIQTAAQGIVAALESALENPSRIRELAEQTGGDPEILFSGIYSGIEAANAIVTTLQAEIETNPYFAIVDATRTQLTELGATEAELEATFTVPDTANPDEVYDHEFDTPKLP